MIVIAIDVEDSPFASVYDFLHHHRKWTILHIIWLDNLYDRTVVVLHSLISLIILHLLILLSCCVLCAD